MLSWWRSRTLRFRLAAWYAAGGTVLLGIFAATIYYYVASHIARPVGQPLRQDLELVRDHLTVRSDGLLLWDGQELRNLPRVDGDYPWFEVWNESGMLVRRVWPFNGRRISEHPVAPTRRIETISIFNVSQDVRLRMLSAPLSRDESGSKWMLRVMRVHEPPADALVALRLIVLTALPITVVLLVLGGYAITHRWLAPLGEMVAHAKRITASNRASRLPIANQADELGQLAGVFNDTLDRLQAAIDALDRFVGDASHELRTPLTTLRSVGEVGLRCSATLEEANETIGSMLEEAQRLQGLTDRMLALARAEGEAEAGNRGLVLVEDCVASVVEELLPRARAKQQSVHVDSMSCEFETDEILLRQSLHNLVENAIKYGPVGGNIWLQVVVSERTVQIAVSDDGPGIPPENRAALMQRFYRPNRARDRESGGYGLGLSIAKAFMRVVGGRLEYSPRDPRGSVFRLELPRDPSPPPQVCNRVPQT
jgi:two-component system OmpR family sensor kinase